MRYNILLICFLLFTQNVNAQEKNLSPNQIFTFFDEVKAATKRNYNLWNKNLYGPILLVDAQTRKIYANESDTIGVLKPDGPIFTGVLPNNVNIANTSLNFGGKRWAMMMLPLPENKKDRINLLTHELFHSIQPDLGFTLHNPENNHLDQKNGRVYLRLELEALKKAILSASKKESLQHIENALAFRKYRHLLYVGSDTTENLLELNEGLAEFTGLIISGRKRKEVKEHLINNLNSFLINPTFVRSFAYQTISVYGYLLYNKNRNWNKEITGKENLKNYIAEAFNIKLQDNLESTIRSITLSYDGENIIQEEISREEQKNKLVAAYKLKFMEQPHFEIKFEKMNVSFDPRNIVPLEDKGTVYPNIRVTDLWGVLTVENGALMSANWSKISVTNPTKIEEKNVTGDGWTLELNEGYLVKKDETTGNYILTKKNK